jgi:hypothetical protein
LTAKVKAALLTALLIAAAGAGMYAGLAIRARQCRAAKQDRAEIAALKARLAAATELSAKPAVQEAAWRDKGSGKKVKAPADCASCLARVRREVEVKDAAHGWWVYHDPDVLDDRAGELTLTPRFFADTAPAAQGGAQNSASDSGRARKLSLSPPEKSLRAGISPASYEFEFSYAPLVISAPRASLRLDLRSRLSLGRSDSALRGDLGAGLEVRW